MVTSLKRVFIIVCYLLYSTSVFAANQQDKYTSFLTLADIHFDPFISCYQQSVRPCPLIRLLREAPIEKWESLFIAHDKILSTYGQDTNFPLFRLMLNKAKKTAQAEHAAFILVLGDLLGHDFRHYYRQYAKDDSMAGYQSFVRKTLMFLNKELAKAFPSLNVYQLIGNNDTDQSDYTTVPHGVFLKEIADIWPSLINNYPDKLLIQQQLREGGYYAFDLPDQPEIRFIILNTVIFSNQAKGPHLNFTAKKELDWLSQELATIKFKHQKAFIAMHIPPTIEINLGVRIHLFTLATLWRPIYKQQFQQLVATYSSVIMAIFSGHLHSDWLSIWTMGRNDIPVTGTPSISPIFGNNPGFKLYRFAKKSLQLIDFSTYYLLLKQGQFYHQQSNIS